MRKVLYIIGIIPIVLFLWISFNYTEEPFVQFDQNMSDLFYGNDVLIAFHYVGETIFVMLVTLVLVLYFWFSQKNGRAVLFILFTVAGGTIINQLLKAYYARPRPLIPNQLDSYSFPSGHSMLGILYLLTLAFLLSSLTNNLKRKTIYWIVAILLFVLIGISRVAEGRHFATDVLGGWSLGLTWFTICTIWFNQTKSK